MKNLAFFWPALEILSSGAVTAIWKSEASDEYPVLSKFLRPTERVASRYPCPERHVQGCTRRIVEYDENDIAAVCDNEWHRGKEIPLRPEDRVVHELDMSKLSSALAPALGFRTHEPSEKAHQIWSIGIDRGSLPERQVLLAVHCEPRLFYDAVAHVVAAFAVTFILAAPTSARRSSELHDLLTQRQIPFISLSDTVGADDAGRLVRLAADTRELFPTPIPERHPLAARYQREVNNCQIQDITNWANVSRGDWYRWLDGTLPDTSVKSCRIERLLQLNQRSR